MKPPAEQPIPVLLDTDAGTDVDDLFALALLLASPEVALAGITTVSAPAADRTLLVRKMLQVAGHEDIPVVTGADDPMQFDVEATVHEHFGHGRDYSDVEANGEGSDAIGFLLEKIAELEGRVHLITIGPLTNAGVLARDHPAAFPALAGLSVMAGTFRGMRARMIEAEYNAGWDPEATERTLQAPVAKRLVGLNVTLQTSLSREQAEQLREGNSLGGFLGRSALHYMDLLQRDSTPMHDSLAVAALLRPELLEWRSLQTRVQTDGQERGVISFREKPATELPGADVAVDLQVEEFQDFFWSRISTLCGVSV